MAAEAGSHRHRGRLRDAGGDDRTDGVGAREESSYTLLIGLTVGCVLAHFLGVFPTERLQQAFAAPMISLPHQARRAGPSISNCFQPSSSPAWRRRCVGGLALCQRINGAEWQRTKMKSVSGGMIRRRDRRPALGVAGRDRPVHLLEQRRSVACHRRDEPVDCRFHGPDDRPGVPAEARGPVRRDARS